jgi:RNA polymerase sigma factor (sigma-70 family)
LNLVTFDQMNQSQFVNLVTPFKQKLFRLAKRLLVSVEEAEDATQEVMLKLWDRQDSLKQYNNVEALAMTMTKNYCLDQLKSKRAGNMKLVHDNYIGREAGLNTMVEDADLWSWAEKIINGLPEQQRMIVQMREIEQYEFEEIAKVMGMQQTAVRVALSRARKTIKEKLLQTQAYGIEQ